MGEVLRLNPRPTAVLAYPDVVAVGALRAAHDLGLAVPRDVSVVGFDDIPLVAYLQPALTTVAVPIRDLGQRAAEMLLRRIRGEASRTAERIVLPTNLIVRDSTAPPPS